MDLAVFIGLIANGPDGDPSLVWKLVDAPLPVATALWLLLYILFCTALQAKARAVW